MAQSKKVRGQGKVLEFKNRRATFDVAVEKTFEAGLILTGDEIKSIRSMRAQLNGAYVKMLGAKMVIVGMHLSEAGAPERSRPLLLHAKEIEEIEKAITQAGKTAVPLRLYLKRGWAKLEVGLGAGRKAHDKRNLIKERDLDRIERKGE